MDFQNQPDTAERPSNSIEFKAVLLVDDDKQLATALQWILADQNFLVDVAYDGEEALLKIKANEYDAIICDVMMPRVAGEAFYQQVAKDFPFLSDRFLFITGQASRNAGLTDFIERTSNRLLEKPFDIEQLRAALQELFSR